MGRKTGFTGLVFGVALLVTACGDEGRDTLMAACEASGSSAEACACRVDMAKKELSPSVYRKVVAAAGSGGDDVPGMFKDMTAKEQTAYLQYARQSILECDLQAPVSGGE